MENLFQKGEILKLKEMIDYSSGGIVSKQVMKSSSGNITLFSFDKGQGLSEHIAPFDAMIQILEGESEVIVGGKLMNLKEGESVILPASVVHAVNAVDRFKMLLTMILG